MRKIKDMHYKVVRVPACFTRVAYMLVIYRHDKDDKAFLYHAEHFYGEDWRKVRSQAFARGRAIQYGRWGGMLRSLWIRVDSRAAFDMLGIYDPREAHGCA
jgi:hypothetical protein